MLYWHTPDFNKYYVTGGYIYDPVGSKIKISFLSFLFIVSVVEYTMNDTWRWDYTTGSWYWMGHNDSLPYNYTVRKLFP